MEVIVDGRRPRTTPRFPNGALIARKHTRCQVLIEPAPVIEHTVSVIGDLKHSFFVNGKHEPLRYQIDGQINPDLMMREERFTVSILILLLVTILLL